MCQKLHSSRYDHQLIYSSVFIFAGYRTLRASLRNCAPYLGEPLQLTAPPRAFLQGQNTCAACLQYTFVSKLEHSMNSRDLETMHM